MLRKENVLSLRADGRALDSWGGLEPEFIFLVLLDKWKQTLL